MSSSIAGLLALQERLISAELETKSGDRWFETWLELLVMEEQTLPGELADLAKRLDKILQVTVGSEAQLSGGVQAEKRAFEEVAAQETVESPPQKKAASEPVTQVEQLPTEAPREVAAVQAATQADIIPQVVETPPSASPVEPAVSLAPEQLSAPVSKLASFLQASETPVAPKSPSNVVGASTPKSPSSPSTSIKAPSSPAASKAPSNPMTSKAPSSLSAIAKPPSSPSATTKSPSSPTPSTKPPSNPSVTAKPPSSPSAAGKSPSSPSNVTKAPSSPSATVKPPLSPLSNAQVPAATTSSPPQSPSPSTSSETKPAPKQTEGGHMDVPDACFDMFQEVKIRKKHRFLIFKIQDWRLELVKVGERSLGLDDFMKELPFSECRFAVYDHEKLKSDQYGSRKAEKVYFVTWQPVPAPTQFKMLYSTERKTLSAVFKGVEEIVATKRDDILFAVGAKDKFAAEDSDDEERGGKGDWMDD